MAKWTEGGWELLEGLALNASAFTGFSVSGKNVKNIFDEDRFWHPFHEGKVLIWKIEENELIFIGAYYSLPEIIYT